MATSCSTSTFVIILCLGLTYIGVDAIRDLQETPPPNPDIFGVGAFNSSLIVPAGNCLQITLLGVGYQIYRYNETAAAWRLFNVSADLYNFVGDKVGYHFYLAEEDSGGGQATWEIFEPFSLVTTTNVVSVPPPPPDEAINWLLNIATNNEGSRTLLGSTTYVQRLYTHAGLAPDVPGNAGDEYYSPYHALYLYYGPSS